LKPPDAYNRPFEQLLQDSVALAELAHERAHGYDLNATFARHSIIDSLLLLESVANTCLESLEIESSVFDELDRLPVVAKFDIYLRTGFANRKLNRGLHVVAALRDLKILRDNFAHPKRQKIIWEAWSKKESTATCEKTSVLGVSRDPSFWHPDEAIIVMRAVHDFVGYYFKALCKFNATQVASLLFSEARRPNRKDYKIPYWNRESFDQLSQWRVDLSYIRIGSLPAS
jgi:hypothetical protein